MRLMIFLMLLIGSCGYALWRGGAPERITAAALLGAAAATVLALSEIPVRFRQVEIGVLIVDLVLLIVLVGVAVRADRAWPLVMAGLHLTAVGAHFVKFVDVQMIRVTYAVSTAIWSYPMLAVLVVGTWRHRARLTAQGHDPAWTRAPGARHAGLGAAKIRKPV